MSDTATIGLGDETYEFPIVVGSEGERAIDIRTLRATTGHITLDSGFMNTGACESAVTFINGEQGILRHHGIPIEQLAEQSNFIEICYLLLHRKLPSATELQTFTEAVAGAAELPAPIVNLIQTFPTSAHPMAVLGAALNGLAGCSPYVSPTSDEEDIDAACINLIGKITSIAAVTYRHLQGKENIAPRSDLDYGENFLNMMFGTAEQGFDEDMLTALDQLLILHADHEQNCSASSVRLVGSSHSNLYAAVAAGVAALWGPLHGGANQAVMEMLAQIHNSGDTIDTFIDMAKDKTKSFRLSGFGHRVYKNYDPRARIIKGVCTRVLSKSAANDPLLDIAVRLEEKTLQDEYFSSRKLYPNVDFYSGLLYKAMGIPTDLFTVMFAIGRLPGWLAHWQEMRATPGGKIGRPRQIYTGNTVCDYVPVAQR